MERPFKVLHGVRGGISRAMNEGLHAATGDVVAHLHSDDFYLHDTVVADVVAALEGRAAGILGFDLGGDGAGEGLLMVPAGGAEAGGSGAGSDGGGFADRAGADKSGGRLSR